ncbi:MAG: type I-C CRISPR-associated protein Cas7/Csd2 [Clostridiales Family XIII bacterium]|jgi:CRISPR-associated protein Csd2|nr:type I-C CRISPR-associated protein Cas7/Csd2 [Clostridiales Family XIII bacterium]
MGNVIANRYDFLLLFDVENGNPNGDPDAGNMPRVDPETGIGLVTDVCIKRKIRNYVGLKHKDESPNKLFIKEVLNDKLEAAYAASNEASTEDVKKTDAKSTIQNAQDYMCENYFDVRTFGAVMSTGNKPAGVVRGPVQLNFAKSIDPVNPQEITITRMAVTTDKEAEKGNVNTMGKKQFVPYGLYRQEGYISARLAQDTTKFNEEDLSLFWEALINMFEEDHSAARGKMVVRKLIIFKHESPIGNAPSHKLFDLVSVNRIDDKRPVRSFSDYDIRVDENNLPAGVSIEEKV